MRFLVSREKLCEAVTNLSRAVATKATFPVLEGIHMTATPDGLKMMAYNLEIGMTKTIDITCAEEGSIVFKAKLLGDILRRLNGPTVSLKVDANKNCHISAANAVFDILTMDARDFPEVPSFSSGKVLNLKGKELIEMTTKTSFAVAPVEGTRQILMGIKVSVKEGVLKFVAIDGFRLAIKKIRIENTEDMEFVISGKNLEELIRLITSEEEVVPITVGNKMISFNCDGYSLICRLMEGEFVNYKKTIPESYKQKIVVKVNDILKIFDRISLLINDSFSTPVRCLIGEEQITFNCSTSMGRVTETYESDLEGEPFEIGLSSRYLTEALKAVDDDMVQIKFDFSKQGVVIEPMQGDDYMYMVMPMRLK